MLSLLGRGDSPAQILLAGGNALRFDHPALDRARLTGGDACGIHVLRLGNTLAQPLEARLLVEVLAALTPACHDDAAWPVLQPDGAVGRVDALPSRTRAAEDLHVAFGEQVVVIIRCHVVFKHVDMIRLDDATGPGRCMVCDTVRMAEKNTRWGFEREDWDTAKRQVKDILIEHARHRETTTYSDLCADVTVIHLRPYSWALMAMLGEVCSEEDAERGTMLASLVTKKDDEGLPGEGYFRHAERLGRDISDRRAFWESEIEKIFAVWAREAE